MMFNQNYNRQEFLRIFQTKICPNFVREERPLQIGRKTAYFVENGIFKLGSINLDKEITVLEIQQKSSKDPRITLTKDAFKVLSDYGIDNAIIIFYSKDNTSYRLSLLTVSYVDLNNKKTSSYKRYSYILGPGEKTKTPENQLLHPIKDYTDLVSRFDVEVVRKDFFEKYLELYVRLYKEVTHDKEFTGLLQSQNVDIVSFTKNLLGKIVFLYFIQQKGWLGLGKKETEYGKGNKNFMRIMRDNFKNSNESMSTEKTGYFYNDYLERLFFAGLNVDRRDHDDWFPNLQMKVPYLNGGLFKEDYQGREGYTTKISNTIFSNVDLKGDDADGILDIFDRYNFTVDEDSLYDSDIAVDPEMLGRMFEKMISISDENIDEVVELYDKKGKNTKIDFGKELNKNLGAFYTPREIVHYMTKESLIAYLVNNTKGDKEQNEDLIRDLFELKEQFLLHQEDLKKVGFGENTLENLSGIIDQIDEALKKVKILDPAVGSGAFPMGLLHEISSIRYYMYGVFNKTFGEKINEYKNKDNKLSLYQIKREIILNNIYGVDIDPGAIDIARLRFWLSLVVDEDQPEPLPNFEFKFVCANTLIPLEEETKEKDLFAQGDEPKLETLKKYKKEYYNASGNKEKRELKERIRDYTKIDGTLFSEPTPRAKQMAEFGANFDNSKHSHSFFDPSLMMSEWRGFDIVIGNPPYGSDISNDMKIYEKLYGKSNKSYFEIYKMFFDLGLKLTKKLGLLIYITPNTFLSQPRYKDIREYLLNFKIDKIVNLGENVFEDVVASVAITLIVNKPTNYIYTLADQSINSKYVGHMNELIFKMVEIDNILNTKDKNLYNLVQLKNKEIILNDVVELKDGGIQYHRSGIGLKNKGGNDLYERLFSDNPDYFANSMPTYYGKLIDAYYIAENTDEFFNLDYKSTLKSNESVSFSKEAFNRNEKIIWRQTASYPKATLDNDRNIWFRNTIQCGWIKENQIKNFDIKYILGLLNSKYLRYKYNAIVREGGKVFPQIKLTHLRNLPIKQITLEEQQPLVEHVDKILAIKKNDSKADTNKLEREIDEMVYKLYGLTEEEIKIVEESVK